MKRRYAIAGMIIVAIGYVVLSMVVRQIDPFVDVGLGMTMRFGLGLVLGMLVMRPAALWHDVQRLSIGDWIAMSIMGVVGRAIAVGFISLSLLHTSLVVFSVLYGLVGMFVMIWQTIVFGKKYPRRVRGCVIVALYGVMLVIMQSPIPVQIDVNQGVRYALLAAASSSVYYLAKKRIAAQIADTTITIVVMAIATVATAIGAVVVGDYAVKQSLLHRDFLVWILIGGGLNILLTYITHFALRHLSALLVTQLLLLENIFAFVIGYWVYDEAMSWWRIVGAIVIVTAIWCLNRYKGDE